MVSFQMPVVITFAETSSLQQLFLFFLHVYLLDPHNMCVKEKDNKNWLSSKLMNMLMNRS